LADPAVLPAARAGAELVPGGIDKEVAVKQARRLLDELHPHDPAAIERHRQALELVTEIEHLDAVVEDSRVRITAAVAASCTTLTEIFGVGPIVAAMLIGYTGDPTRFAIASRYAAYTGIAPIEFSSGGRTTHRLSRRGNRRLNHALHCAAITQIRHRHSLGRGHYERKLAADHTPREPIRALKRRLSDVAWRHLVADAQRAVEA
jgi:transposase